MASASLAGRSNDLLIARIFGIDAPAVAAPFMARVVLAEDGWRVLIPAMPATTRNILRNRRDLGPVAVDLLRHFAPGDMALPSAPSPPATVPGVTAIQELVDRIATFRERLPQAPPVEQRSPSGEFVFETDLHGTIDWVEGAPREAIVGLSVAEAAPLGGPGVDGQATGAWRRRAPIGSARLQVAGSGDAGGTWLISAAPLFNPMDGKFCGYRGQARRPDAGERARGDDTAAPSADTIRQLVHELRTPLNAIHGFAEMIDLQLLGPVDATYRAHAHEVIADAQRLMAIVDDLDTAARLDSGISWHDEQEPLDLGDLVEAAVVRHRAALAAAGVGIDWHRPSRHLPVIGSPIAIDRMISRLLAAVGALAADGETLAVSADAAGSDASCSITRPSSIAGRDEPTLLDPDFGIDGEWPDGALLGLGFTLRLVARLAGQGGGKLVILPDRFALTLPAFLSLADGRLG